jgi:2-polyprenyl-3-methyl-5-hydroxy-6-metoxy-1,4-benzoquinol methylase
MMSVIDMIESIKLDAPFDIVSYACPEDQASYLLEDMRDHFNTLHAVGKAIAPDRILGCNICYGYGAAALLHAAPGASYEGLHAAASPDHAVAWAEQMLAAYPKACMAAESSLLHETYDLMEISGTGDGDYLFSTLERYACRSSWFVASMNMMAVNDTMALSFWLRKYHKLIRHAHLLPTRQGIWLVEMKEASGRTLSPDTLSYKDTEQFYTGEYFLTDCGGFPQFRKSNGLELSEPRLVAIYALASPGPGMRILDVGCGRGELAFALAQAGAEVLAIDYSADAAALARNTYGELEICKSRKLIFEQQDLFAAEFVGQFDLVIAADFIEHIDSALEETAIRKLHAFLKPGGKLIIHTAPNLLNYRYAYKKRRQLAQRAGSYLPPNPRTFYEQVVHINEQTPARLRRLLRRSFSSAVTWVASDPDARGTLAHDRRNDLMVQGLSIFSVASDVPVRREEILDKLSQRQVEMNGPGAVTPNAQTLADVGVQGHSKSELPAFIRKIAKISIRLAGCLTSFIAGEQRSKYR